MALAEWALIACRTVRDFHAADSVQVAEYPKGSGTINAVLAAAWQFRVRPPRKDGTSLVGEWVRTRTDHAMRPQRRNIDETTFADLAWIHPCQRQHT